MVEAIEKLIAVWPEILFYTMGSVTVACAIATVVTQNVVRAAAWLLFTLTGTAGLFFLLGADFVAATQLLIYVGGTLILVIFGVMLTARGPFVQLRTTSGEWILAACVGLALLGLLGGAIMSTGWKRIPQSQVAGRSTITAENSPTTMQLGLEFLGVPPADPAVPRDPAGIGYLLPFEIVSVHLLVVLIGAAYLARAKRRRATGP